MVVPFWTPITPLAGFLLHADPQVSAKLTSAASAVLQALSDTMAENGGKPASEKDWRASWEKSLPADLKDDSRRKAWARNRDKLRKLEMVQCNTGLWWPIEPQQIQAAMDFTPASLKG